MSRKASERQEERKTARQPEYTVIKREQRARAGAQPYQAPPTKTRPSKKTPRWKKR